jgi:ribosomal protein S15P/S13E
MAEETTKPLYIRKHKGRVNNTCANSSKVKRLTRQLAGIMAHLVVHPRDTLSQTRVSTINQLLRQ